MLFINFYCHFINFRGFFSQWTMQVADTQLDISGAMDIGPVLQHSVNTLLFRLEKEVFLINNSLQRSQKVLTSHHRNYFVVRKSIKKSSTK